MINSPFLNGLGASLYIVLGVTFMTLLTQNLKDKPDTFFAPIVFLSTLTLSVAVMAYLFFYQPLQLLLEKKNKEAVNLFFQTVGVFGVITVGFLVLLLLGIV